MRSLRVLTPVRAIDARHISANALNKESFLPFSSKSLMAVRGIEISL